QFFLKRHLIYVALSCLALLVALFFDYRQLRTLAPLLFGMGILGLLMVLTPLGRSALGAQRWIDLGIFQLQPSEMMKIILVIAGSSILASERAIDPAPMHVLAVVGVAAAPGLLIFKQPDLGTVMVLLAIAFGILLVAGTRMRWLMLVIGVGVVSLGLAFQLGVLKDYQVARLTSFLDSQTDTQRADFNLHQSKIAIGSGGLTGKGLGRGSQTNLAYVPSQHTDFIFTAIGEEVGFVGAVLVLGVFGFLLWRCIRIASLSKDRFGTLLAIGIASMLAFQLFVNVGMTVGIMPITGIPLPFVSYGGSSLITNFLAVGLLMNVHMRRFT
ncbi:MAG TPA: rod shape-determining protein RodA, partial [Actinomycetota bacterium]|nr:rod shape-determining protein RodA [Actinomycetota bacterium]